MWHKEVVDAMAGRALTELDALGCKGVQVHSIPGSFELPLAARLLFEKQPELDGILAFGVVLKGQTSHDQSVLQEVTSGFSRVMEKFGKPVINEVIGVSTLEDAVARSGANEKNKGLEAVFAISEFLHWKHALPKQGGKGLGFSLALVLAQMLFYFKPELLT